MEEKALLNGRWRDYRGQVKAQVEEVNCPDGEVEELKGGGTVRRKRQRRQLEEVEEGWRRTKERMWRRGRKER